MSVVVLNCDSFDLNDSGAERQAELIKIIYPHVTQCIRYTTGQLIVAEQQLSQVGEFAQFCRQPAGQPVAGEVQFFQTGDVAQFRRQLPGQPVARELQSGNFASGGGDAVPRGGMQDAQPEFVVRPARAVGGVVERNQGFKLRCSRACPGRGWGPRRSLLGRFRRT